MFEAQVASFMGAKLPGSWERWALPGVLSETPCPVLWDSEKRLALHLVSLSSGISDPLFFRRMSLYALEREVHLIHLWEDVWSRSPSLVCSRLRVLTGGFERIHGRLTEARKIAAPEAHAFLTTHNLYGSPHCRYKYGLFLGSQLVAVATFGGRRPLPRVGGVAQSYELIRYASLPGVRVSGGLSKLLSAFVREVHPDDLMTYADLDWSTGAGYRKLGFKRVAVTEPLMFWVHPLQMIRMSPRSLSAVEGKSEECWLAEGYQRVYNAGNLKFLWTP